MSVNELHVLNCNFGLLTKEGKKMHAKRKLKLPNNIKSFASNFDLNFALVEFWPILCC